MDQKDRLFNLLGSLTDDEITYLYQKAKDNIDFRKELSKEWLTTKDPLSLGVLNKIGILNLYQITLKMIAEDHFYVKSKGK